MKFGSFEAKQGLRPGERKLSDHERGPEQDENKHFVTEKAPTLRKLSADCTKELAALKESSSDTETFRDQALAIIQSHYDCTDREAVVKFSQFSLEQARVALKRVLNNTQS